MTASLPGVGAQLGTQPENPLDGFSGRSRTGKVISRKKNIYRGIPISTSAPGPHTMGDHVAESPTIGFSFRARLNTSSVRAESQVR
jgi:hypothetical protein